MSEVLASVDEEPRATPQHSAQAWFGADGNKLVTAAWLAHGVDLPAVHNVAAWSFHTPPMPSHNLSNHSSIIPHLDRIADHFDELAHLGIVEQFNPVMHGSERQFAAVISPLHAVPKPDSSSGQRPCLDCTSSGVNGCMLSLPCELPDVHDLLQQLPPSGFLGKRDLASGFFHVKLAPEARRYVAYRHPRTGALQRFAVLPFGASQSPAIFVGVTGAARDVFQAECDRRGLSVKVFVYVDDFMLMGKTHADIRGAFDVLDSQGRELGLEWKASKDRGRETPLQQLDFLGLRFDTVLRQMSMPPDKRQRYAADVHALLVAGARGPVVRRDLEATVGRLNFAARACRWGYTFLQGLYDALFYPGQRPPPVLPLPAAAREELLFWWDILRDGSSLWDGVRPATTSNLDLVGGLFLGPDGAEIFTDASGQGYGAAWGTAELQGVWDAEQRALHIAWLELTAILQALRAWAPQLGGKHVLVHCDNTQAVAAVNHGSTRIREGRDISRQLAELVVRYGFELRAVHIRGVDNVRADQLSRRLPKAATQQLCLRAELFRQLCALWGQSPTVDCCCNDSGSNAQPGCTVSFSPSNSVLGKEAQLAGCVLWAHPPTELVGEVLGTLVRAYRMRPHSTRILAVVPEYRERGWFKQFVSSPTAPFRVLHRFPVGQMAMQHSSGAAALPLPHELLALCLP